MDKFKQPRKVETGACAQSSHVTCRWAWPHYSSHAEVVQVWAVHLVFMGVVEAVGSLGVCSKQAEGKQGLDTGIW